MNSSAAEPAARGWFTSGLPRRRRVYGVWVAILGPIVLTLLLLPFREGLGLDTVLMLFVLVSVAASAVGGLLPAVVASAIGCGLATYSFTRPYGSLSVASSAEVIDLVTFFAVSALVGVGTEWAARASARSERARVRAELLADLGNRQEDPESVESALATVRARYEVDAVALLRDDTVVARAGSEPAEIEPDAQAAQVWLVDAGDGLRLRLVGPERIGQDGAMLNSLAATIGRLWRARELAEQARRAEELGRIDELRASLLAAVGHDLRNPLAAITAAAETLRAPGLQLGDDDRDELLHAIEEHTGRLNEIIGNLLDLSRLQAGALSVQLAATSVWDVMLDVLRLGQQRVQLAIPDELPLVWADAGLLQRVVANLVDNADRHVPEGQQVTIAAGRVGERRVAIRVVDHGPGVDPARFGEIFAPFQHFGDRTTTGVGLGLGIAKGFTEAMGGSLTPSTTEGGGLTMTVTLGTADAATADR